MEQLAALARHSFVGDRRVLAVVIAAALSAHGLRKKSLNASGAAAAFFVGFVSFTAGVRFGTLLILFYFTGSQLTKMGSARKATFEEGYTVGGQRSWVQVFACSILATACAVVYMWVVGEDTYVDFGETAGWMVGRSAGAVTVSVFGLWQFTVARRRLGSYLWAMYVAHYACAAADTWASEVGVLARSPPVLITSLLALRPRRVPPGTNGGVSVPGTLASAAGGLAIGLTFFGLSFALGLTPVHDPSRYPDQLCMAIFGMFSGLLGSIVDSLLGAIVQATYYSVERKCIVKRSRGDKTDPSVVHVCGYDWLSNEAVNVVSTLITMVVAAALAPTFCCLFDPLQCGGSAGAVAAAKLLNVVPRPAPFSKA